MENADVVERVDYLLRLIESDPNLILNRTQSEGINVLLKDFEQSQQPKVDSTPPGPKMSPTEVKLASWIISFLITGKILNSIFGEIIQFPHSSLMAAGFLNNPGISVGYAIIAFLVLIFSLFTPLWSSLLLKGLPAFIVNLFKHQTRNRAPPVDIRGKADQKESLDLIKINEPVLIPPIHRGDSSLAARTLQTLMGPAKKELYTIGQFSRPDAEPSPLEEKIYVGELNAAGIVREADLAQVKKWLSKVSGSKTISLLVDESEYLVHSEKFEFLKSVGPMIIKLIPVNGLLDLNKGTINPFVMEAELRKIHSVQGLGTVVYSRQLTLDLKGYRMNAQSIFKILKYTSLEDLIAAFEAESSFITVVPFSSIIRHAIGILKHA